MDGYMPERLWLVLGRYEVDDVDGLIERLLAIRAEFCKPRRAANDQP